ncbi:restriction endonuclease [Candidatus Viridilinea mediisalina]|uniref:Restriction endonuclease n=1 Tax=Candidatus Viridilinea mediisalina TaxID=2024553 RepID=A0A2A6RLY9_9CHLR|nr:restriction endonuclease [Candidatus Viridilinea mediisalina]PDW04082.1 restriction endonuclease [Candidatus Viridilinea mediisalina]
MKSTLTIETLMREASHFSQTQSICDESSLYGVTDGKAVGTYIEHKFKFYLATLYVYEQGNSASGIDFPEMNTDVKVTSITQPQSSSPFKSARQKIYGLGYHLLIFVYQKIDDHAQRTSRLDIKHVVFVDEGRTADYQMTRGILEILEREGNIEDLVAFMQDKNLPVDEIAAKNLAEEIMKSPPLLGYLTVSNALQWRLQYGRVLQQAGLIEGIYRVR